MHLGQTLLSVELFQSLFNPNMMTCFKKLKGNRGQALSKKVEIDVIIDKMKTVNNAAETSEKLFNIVLPLVFIAHTFQKKSILFV